ncbi:MAG: lipopolysaccharide biosynthesis protein [Eubacteriales bacterium]
MEQKGNRSFFKDFLTLSAGTLVYMIVGFIGTPIITRLVDPVDYGQMSMLTVYSNFGLMACGLGLDQTLLRYFYKDDIHYQRKLVFTCCGFPMLAAALIGILMVLAHTVGFQWLTFTELILLEINVVVLLLHRFATLLLRLRTHTKTYSAVNVIQKISYILLTVVLILIVKDHHFIILAVSTILSTLLAALIAIFFERDIWHLPDQGYAFPLKKTELLKYGFPIMLSSSINVVFSALDKLFIQHFCTLTDVGIYASAMNLMAVFSVVRTSFNAIWMPAAVEHYEKNQKDKKFYQQGNAFISILMLSFGATVVLCKDLFVMLLGNKYQTASMVVPYLMFEPIMYTISETTATGIVVQKKSVYQVIVAGGSCLINFIGNWLLVPIMGVQGAALSTGLSYIVFFALRTGLANRVFYVNYRLPKFFAAVVALFAFAVYGSNHSFSWMQVAMFLGVMAVIIVAYWKDVRWSVNYGVQIIKKSLQKTKD